MKLQKAGNGTYKIVNRFICVAMIIITIIAVFTYPIWGLVWLFSGFSIYLWALETLDYYLNYI